MEGIYTIVLADGTRLEGLKRNGTNYISEIPILDTAFFENNCSPMHIMGGEKDELIEHGELTLLSIESDGCHIAFRSIPESEIREAKIRSDIDYLAMMTNIDLGEG